MGRWLLFLVGALLALAIQRQQTAVRQDTGTRQQARAGAATVEETRPTRTRQLRSTSAPVPRIVNGVRAGGFYPTVGTLTRNGSLQCSGVLIGCHTFLTASHCVFDPVVPEQYSVFLQHLGFIGVSSIVRNPDAAFAVRSDQAVLTLSTDVSGIAPSTINTVAEPPLGTLGDIVGFGSVGELFGPGSSNFFSGIKRRGDAVTAACTVVPESSHICWTFAAPLGPPGTDSNTCKGDSGGPMFATVAGLGTAVVGTTSGGNSSCLPDETPFDADTHFDHEWIESVAGADLGPISCGPIPPVLGPGSVVLYDQFAMDSTDAGVVYDFVVPADKSRLRITTNGEVTPFQNYNLYVKLGSEPSVDPPDFDCASTRGNDSFEACAFNSPAAGQWFVLVDNSLSTDGEFDVTVSILGGPTPTPSPTTTATPTQTATPTPTPTATPTLTSTPPPCTPLDPDGNGAIDPPTDGVLVVRHLFGFIGTSLTLGALGEDATRDAAQITAFLGGCSTNIDIDGDGAARALTDGLLFLRYLFGLRDNGLIDGALGDDCSRCTADEIEAYIDALI